MKLKKIYFFSVLKAAAADDDCAKMVKECKSSQDGITTYHGVKLSQTSSGKACRNWKEIEYIRDDLAHFEDNEIKNYCRWEKTIHF